MRQPCADLCVCGGWRGIGIAGPPQEKGFAVRRVLQAVIAGWRSRSRRPRRRRSRRWASPATAPAQGPDAPRIEIADAARRSRSASRERADRARGRVRRRAAAALRRHQRAAGADARPTPRRPRLPRRPRRRRCAVAPIGPEDPQLAAAADAARQLRHRRRWRPRPTSKTRTRPRSATSAVTRARRGRARRTSSSRCPRCEEGDGKAANATQVAARAKEDEALAVRLMKSLGYYDAHRDLDDRDDPADAEHARPAAARPSRATPGRLYTLSSVTVKADADDARPTWSRSNLPLKVGDPIEAARIQGAEANVSLIAAAAAAIPSSRSASATSCSTTQTPTGAYTLPVDTGPRSSFGQLTTEGDPVFELEHLNVFPRFEPGRTLRQPQDRRSARRAGRDRAVLDACRSSRCAPGAPARTGPSRSTCWSARPRGRRARSAARRAIRPGRASRSRAAGPTATCSRPKAR